MKFFSRIIGIVLFILFFFFALKNSQEVTFFLGYEVRVPLVLLLLAFFAGGAILGVLAMMPTVFRYRRKSDLQKDAAAEVPPADGAQTPGRTPPSQPDTY